MDPHWQWSPDGSTRPSTRGSPHGAWKGKTNSLTDNTKSTRQCRQWYMEIFHISNLHYFFKNIHQKKKKSSKFCKELYLNLVSNFYCIKYFISAIINWHLKTITNKRSNMYIVYIFNIELTYSLHSSASPDLSPASPRSPHGSHYHWGCSTWNHHGKHCSGICTDKPSIHRTGFDTVYSRAQDFGLHCTL